MFGVSDYLLLFQKMPPSCDFFTFFYEKYRVKNIIVDNLRVENFVETIENFVEMKKKGYHQSRFQLRY